METIFIQAKNLQEQLILWRRALHQIPETGLFLPKTAEYVKAQLREMCLSYQEFTGHSGITVCIGQGERKVALRADMDALPIHEESGESFAATGDFMHACGHDSHTAMLLGAAKLLKMHEKELSGTVQLIFQPAEEGPGGAEPMVQDGVLNGVEAIFALHGGDLAGRYPSGQIAVSYGETFAADDEVVIDIVGEGGHGSRPDLCVDPVAVATLIINNLQYIISREISPYQTAVLTISCVSAGKVCNIIPETASIRGTIRNATPEVREYMCKRIREIAEGTAAMMRARCTVSFAGYPALVNNKEVVDSFLNTAKKQIREEDINILPHGLLGGEDAAFFFREVPGCYFFLPSNAPCPADGQVYGLHNSKFCVDESVFWLGSGLMAQSAIDWLNNPFIRNK